MKELRIPFEEEIYQKLKEKKEKLGQTWYHFIQSLIYINYKSIAEALEKMPGGDTAPIELLKELEKSK